MLLHVSSTPTRVFAARLAGLPVFDPQGDQVGKVRDVVVVVRSDVRQPRVVGLVVEVFGRRQIFVPMTRVTNIDAGQVITTGLVNMRRFEQRSTETLVIGADARPHGDGEGAPASRGTVYDVAIEQARNRDWVVSRVALKEGAKGFRRRGQTHVVEWGDVEGLHDDRGGQQGATHLIASLEDISPPTSPTSSATCRSSAASRWSPRLDDERLADVLEELPEEDQVEILEHLDSERAADVLEEMSADDAADLIADLPPETAAAAARADGARGGGGRPPADGVRRATAGGMMTPEPVILPPDATVAEALAHVRNEELTPSLAALVYVCRPPLETPTGKLLGVAHIQRLLREPPSTLVAGVLDDRHRPACGPAPPWRTSPAPGDLQPRRRAGRRRGRPAARRGHGRRPARPHAPRGLARPHAASREAPCQASREARTRATTARSRPRLDTPRDYRRRLVPPPERRQGHVRRSSPSSSPASWAPRSS